jgi:hypothetical protein
VSTDFVSVARPMLLGAAVLQFAVATVLFGTLQARVIQPMLKAAEGQGRPVAPALRWYFTSRVPAVAMVAVLLGLAWFVGTPTAATLLSRIQAGS